MLALENTSLAVDEYAIWLDGRVNEFYINLVWTSFGRYCLSFFIESGLVHDLFTILRLFVGVVGFVDNVLHVVVGHTSEAFFLYLISTFSYLSFLKL